ncbi:MAG: hypothetical protein J6C64_06210 [Lachnospiraceae bacterium]|nr:hypothetical protein [Lachnospiraceae bacterium]
MRKRKNIGDKGFSLAEIIMVFAVITILIILLSSQLLGYVERVRQKKDIQQAKTVHMAITAAVLSPAADDAPEKIVYDSLAELYNDTERPNFVKTVKEMVEESDASKLEGAGFVSKAYKGSGMKVEIEGSEIKLSVAVSGSASEGDRPIEIE